MNRYIAAIAIGIGLMAHSSASAEKLEFINSKETRVEHCYEAAKKGIQIGVSQPIPKPGGQAVWNSFLVSRGDFGVWYGTGDPSLWRIYQLYIEPKPIYGYSVSCW